MSFVHIAALGLSLVLAGYAAADGPSAEDIHAQWETYMEAEQAAGRGLTREGVAQWATGALVDLDVTTLSASDLAELSWIIDMVPAKKAQLVAHLEVLSKAPDADGFEAAVLLARQHMNSAEELDIEALLSHPGLRTAIETGQASSLFSMLGYADPAALKAHKAVLVGIVDTLTASGKPDNLMAAAGLATGLAKPDVGLDKAQRNAMFDHIVIALRKAVAADPDNAMEFNDRMESRAVYLAGPAARGELIGNEAPNLNFLWVSNGGTQKSLRDYKGKVVVLDFWATWCGPCVGSFPQVRELQERYKDYDVAILGVTSVQGQHYGGGKPVDVEGKPEAEFKLMQQFMGEKDVTWTVAFSTDEVFNPNYGVNGIPHVAILDTQGRVIENGLHPGMEVEHKYELIDGLLAKAGKKHPEPFKPEHDHGSVPHDHDGDGHPDH
jgi:thiol-disulfide isomerase/thioredoxin